MLLIIIVKVLVLLLGLNQKYSPGSMAAGCDFCYLIIVSTSKPLRPILELVDTGDFQFELTCTYDPHKTNRCPVVLSHAKDSLNRQGERLGESLTQYANTPSCDNS